MDWSLYRNFDEWEFKCKYTGSVYMKPQFMSMIQKRIREPLAVMLEDPRMVVNSGYRDKFHPREAAKKEPGEHSYGCAADFQAWGEKAKAILQLALVAKVGRIGIHQTGPLKGRFIHLGMGDELANFPKAIWTY